MKVEDVARYTVAVAKVLLMLSLLSVLVSWRVSAALFLAGCVGYAVSWLLSGDLPSWIVPANE